MNNYWLSFRIKDDPTYEQRYQSLKDAIAEHCDGWWAETSSFYLALTGLDIDAFGRAITKGLRPSTDMLVMRYVSSDSSRYFGAVNAALLKQHLPNVKKL